LSPCDSESEQVFNVSGVYTCSRCRTRFDAGINGMVHTNKRALCQECTDRAFLPNWFIGEETREKVSISEKTRPWD
jgi:DNA-directed RNA polymerase subunit RPC12/RpoP